MSGNAFLAVDITDEERHNIAAALTEASGSPVLPGRRPPIENWHITLRFLGNCSETQSEIIMHELSESIEQLGDGWLDGALVTRVWCDGVGAFPRISRAGVIYISLNDKDGILTYLSSLCEDAAVGAGLEPEERPYVPHITLSRLRPSMDVREILSSYATFSAPIVVSGVSLFRSRGSGGGLRYEVVDKIGFED